MRTCTKCGVEQDEALFYNYANGKPMAQCKPCIKARVRRHRVENIDRVRQYDRERSSLPHRKVLRERISRDYNNGNPERYRAHYMVSNALRDGRLSKEPCSFCGSMNDLEAHHHDYSAPLDVTWLCTPCHRKFHGLERMATYREEKAA